MSFDPASRSLLTRRDLGRFPGETLFARVARAACEAGCLPRKELFESWEVARRVRRRMRGRRVVELAAGHALVAHLLLLLDTSSESAVAIDAKPVPSAETLAEALASRWPRLAGRVERRVADLATATHRRRRPRRLGARLRRALGRRARAGDRARGRTWRSCPAVTTPPRCDTGGLLGFLPIPLAIDATRVARLRAAGYDVVTQTIPAEITPHNRLILGLPRAP